ncbi:MAG: tetratricopeptide repeat protein, partial [Candidatus Poribacteria bacterium]|nr:tetratricopeptide repeat protein [Candidatus Poribacteria bacterium]
ALDPDLVEAHYNLGHAYIEQGHSDKAIPHLERAIAISPNLKGAHYNLARAHRVSGNLEAATHALTETLRIDPNYRPAHELGNTIKQAHYNRGITYLNGERYSEAVTAFQSAITLDSDFTTAHYNLGLTFLKMESYPRAVDALQKTITLDPTHVAAHHSLALAYLGQQELGKARDTARKGLAVDPNYQSLISFLAAIDPSFTPPEKQTRPEPEEAIQQARPTPSPVKSPEQTTALDIPDRKRDLERGMIFLNNRQYNQAVAAFKRVIKADANSVEAHYGLGQAYLGIEAFDDAQAAANEALRRNPNHPPTRELIQLIKFAKNREKNRGRRRTILRYAVILGMIALGIFAGIRFEVIPWPDPMPPIISIAASLEEPSGNDFLDADETGYIRLTISNKGGTARNVELRLEPRERTSFAGLTFIKPTLISELKKKSIETIRIRVTAAKKIQGREQSLQVQLLDMDKIFLATKDFTFQIIPQTPRPEPPRGR